MTFTPEHNSILWITSSGPVRLTRGMAEGLLDIFSKAADQMLHEIPPARVESRTVRALYLDLDEAVSVVWPVAVEGLKTMKEAA